MNYRKFFAFILVSFFFSLTALAFSTPGKQDDYSTAIRDGNVALRAGKVDDAIKCFKRANKLHNNRSSEAFERLAVAYSKQGNVNAALDNARKSVKFATTSQEQVMGHDATGAVLVEEFNANKTDKHSVKYAVAAESEFRMALQVDPNDAFASEGLGKALLKQSKDADGIAVLKQYLQNHPGAVDAAYVQRLIANPLRARQTFVPDFSAATLRNGMLSTENLRGKVLVLDFWATWCKGCVESIPDIRSLSKKFTSQPVVVISISVDKNKDTWQKYVESHDMPWTQINDGAGKIAHAYGIRVLPTYVVVDTEGVLATALVGEGPERLNQMEDAVKKSLKSAAKESAAVNAAAGS